MENKTVYAILALILLSSLAANLYVLYYEPLPEDAYFSLRYAEHVKEKFTPLTSDELSYGGRNLEEPFLYYYLLGLAAKIDENLVRIIAALITTSIILVVFLISSTFISKGLSLIPSVFAAFLPAMFKISIISPNVLAFLILFLLIYSFMRINEKGFLYLFIILSFLLPLTSFLSIFFIFAALIFLFIMFIEGKRLSELEWETLLFSIFVNVLVVLMMFRNSLLSYGPSFIWQNIPSSVLMEYFREFSPVEIITVLGLASLILGVIGFAFSFKEKNSLLLSSFFISALVFLWLRIIPFSIGLILLSLSLAALSAISLKVLNPYIKRTKFSKFRDRIVQVLFALAIITSVVPVVFAVMNYESKVSASTENAIETIGGNGSVILAPHEYGHAITYAGSKNVADSLFLLAPAPDKRVKDIEIVYSSQSETTVLEIMRRYEVDYLVLDDYAREKFGVNELSYIGDKKCFSKVYDEKETKVYRFKCG